MRLMITIHDNDFYFTFESVLNALLYISKQNPNFTIQLKDKEFASSFIKALTYPFFLATSKCHKSEFGSDKRFKTEEEYKDFYSKYLTVYPKNIFIDDEIEQHPEVVAEITNGEFYIIDFDTGEFNCI